RQTVRALYSQLGAPRLQAPERASMPVEPNVPPAREPSSQASSARATAAHAERARSRRQRAAAKLALRPKEESLEASANDDASVSERPSRIQLVPPVRRDPLPEWLESMRPNPARR
ncbi:MAG TPA: hypothetical protein VMG12_35915, partial [Polyangiaceae bacterium]|nr:hypothetical protein [Polyangiaceae bacterium]